MKRWGTAMIMLASLVILGAGCGQTPTQSGASSTSNDRTVEVNTTPTASQDGSTGDSDVQELELTARQFQFEPSALTVKMGTKVRLSIRSIDVEHGFSLPESDVSATLKPGATTVVEFIPNRKGEFTFSCSVFCGEGHPSMKGKLIVE